MCYLSKVIEPVVYRIDCAPTGRVYIGSTTSPSDRWRVHCADLAAGRHRNRFLQAAWQKYGAGAFTFTVVEHVTNEADLVVRERTWIDALGAWAPAGFNLADPTDPGLQAAKRYVVTEPDGTVHEVLNLHRFCRERSIPSTCLFALAHARKPAWKGWRCRAKTETAERWLERVNVLLACRRTAREARARLTAARQRERAHAKRRQPSFIVIAPDGTQECVTGLKSWTSARSLNYTMMLNVASGSRRHCHGYTCRRIPVEA